MRIFTSLGPPPRMYSSCSKAYSLEVLLHASTRTICTITVTRCNTRKWHLQRKPYIIGYQVTCAWDNIEVILAAPLYTIVRFHHCNFVSEARRVSANRL